MWRRQVQLRGVDRRAPAPGDRLERTKSEGRQRKVPLAPGRPSFCSIQAPTKAPPTHGGDLLYLRLPSLNVGHTLQVDTETRASRPGRSFTFLAIKPRPGPVRPTPPHPGGYRVSDPPTWEPHKIPATGVGRSGRDRPQAAGRRWWDGLSKAQLGCRREDAAP